MDLEVKHLQRVNLFKGWKVIHFLNNATLKLAIIRGWERRRS